MQRSDLARVQELLARVAHLERGQELLAEEAARPEPPFLRLAIGGGQGSSLQAARWSLPMSAEDMGGILKTQLAVTWRELTDRHGVTPDAEEKARG